MRRVNVNTYPVRYAANDNPGALVVLTPDADGNIHPCGFGPRPASEWMAESGRELAAYSVTWQTPAWPSVVDGISAMVRRNGGAFWVEVFASLPSTSRRQRTWTAEPTTFEEALQAAEALIDRAHVWVRAGMAAEVPVVLSNGLLCWLDRRHPGVAFRGLFTRPAAILEMYGPRGPRAVRAPDGPRLTDSELLELQEAMLAAHRSTQIPLPFAA